MALTEFVTGTLQLLTLLSDIALVFLLLAFIWIKASGRKVKVPKALSKNSLLLAFIVSLVATLGSLFYSEVMGLTPCKLCWIQRIFMYPLPIILGISMYRKKDARAFIIPLAFIGSLVSVWQYLLQRFPSSTPGLCSIASNESCSIIYTFAYGYITIPVMAFTAFVLVMVLLWKD